VQIRDGLSLQKNSRGGLSMSVMGGAGGASNEHLKLVEFKHTPVPLRVTQSRTINLIVADMGSSDMLLALNIVLNMERVLLLVKSGCNYVLNPVSCLLPYVIHA
jgi:hypothetical protein